MKVIVTGATGTAGSEVVRQCLADAGIEQVTVLSRRPLELTHPKLQVLLHEDFENYTAVLPQLGGHEACLWCLGISQSQVTRPEYERITVDFTLAAARAFGSVNPGLTFCFLSGQGADSTEKSRVLFARVKGKAENHLLALLERVYCFRPGFINPLHPQPNSRLLKRLTAPLGTLMRKVSEHRAVNADELARAMIRAARLGAPKKVLENADILALDRAARGV